MHKKKEKLYTEKTLSFVINVLNDMNDFASENTHNTHRIDKLLDAVKASGAGKKSTDKFNKELAYNLVRNLTGTYDFLVALTMLLDFMHQHAIPFMRDDIAALTASDNISILKDIAPDTLKSTLFMKEWFERYQLIHCDDLTDKNDKNE